MFRENNLESVCRPVGRIEQQNHSFFVGKVFVVYLHIVAAATITSFEVVVAAVLLYVNILLVFGE